MYIRPIISRMGFKKTPWLDVSESWEQITGSVSLTLIVKEKL